MNQWQRQQYLQAMGVDLLVPRLILPGAKASVGCPLSENQRSQLIRCKSTAVGLASTAEEASSVTAKSTASPLQTRPAMTLDLPGKTQEQSATTVQRIDVRGGEKLKFQLLFASHPSGCLLVCPCVNGRLPLEQQRLLGDIQLALSRIADSDVAEQSEAPQPQGWHHEQFRWPLERNRIRDGGEAAARQTLSSFFFSKIQQKQINRVVLLGSDAARYLYPSGIDLKTAMVGEHTLAGLSLQPLLAPGLDELLAQAALKRDLWHQLLKLFATKTTYNEQE